MPDKSSCKANYRKLAALSSLGLMLPSSIAVGLFMGYLLDKLFGTHPWLLAFFTLLGVASGFLSLFLFSPRTSLFILAGGAALAATFLWLKQVEAHLHNHMLHTAAELGIPGLVDSIPLGAKPGIFFWVSWH